MNFDYYLEFIFTHTSQNAHVSRRSSDVFCLICSYNLDRNPDFAVPRARIFTRPLVSETPPGE